jgi:hypothetical protein
MLDGLAVEFRKGQQIFFSLKLSGPGLDPTQLTIQGLPGISLSLPEINWPVREADQSSRSSVYVKMSGAIAALHLRLHGVDRENFTVFTYTYICIYTAECAKYIRLYTALCSESYRNAIRMKSESSS